jgi:hypothetical protein
MDPLIIIIIIACIAGMIARSLFVTQRPPQRISVHAAPAERSGGGSGCLPLILVGPCCCWCWRRGARR